LTHCAISSQASRHAFKVTDGILVKFVASWMEHGGVDGIDEKLNLCNRQQALCSAVKVEDLVETRLYKGGACYVFGKDPKSPTPQSQKEAGSADLF
jgi:hypothetical protein